MENKNQKNYPGIIRMVRAPFFSSVLSPIIAGVILGVLVSGEFSLAGFILVIIMGMGLHTATNVYNDIYDTFQGTDKVNVHRNEFSGGSGILVDFPELLPKMLFLARTGLVIAFLATIGLLFVIDRNLYPVLIFLFLMSAFFSKYYTAAPPKLAYRGLGEISVWFAFGPMALLVGAVSQSVAFESPVLALMPVCGLSTSSILWMGQMIDLEADRSTGKLGMVARLGTQTGRYGYVIIQVLLIANIILAFLTVPEYKWYLLLSLIPYVLLIGKIFKIVLSNHDDPDGLKPGAKLNVLLHLSFSFLFIVSLLLHLFF